MAILASFLGSRILTSLLDRFQGARSGAPGTVVTADLDPAFAIDEKAVSSYLQPYVQFLPVPLEVNGSVISQRSFENALVSKTAGFSLHSEREIAGATFAGRLRLFIDGNGRVLVRLSQVLLNKTKVPGEVILVQQGGRVMGYRNLFGLAPIPVSGHYQFGGIVNLNVLHPTAGREALSRESIRHVADLVALIEEEVSRDVAETDVADQNQCFQQYILAHGKTEFAKNLRITVLPDREDVALQSIVLHDDSKPLHYYEGRDQKTIQKFATEQSTLLHVSQVNPRRQLQLRYLASLLNIEKVPEKTIVERIPATRHSLEQAMFLVRVRGVLLDDYLLPNADVAFADMSHGVAFHVEGRESTLEIMISKDLPAVETVIECFRTARDVFDGFVKDFVREHLYPHIRDHVPSSTRQGRDALYRRLKENKELFRYEEGDFGKLESLLADFISGRADIKNDLEKLSRLQTVLKRRWQRAPLAWMVYGDHMNEEVHHTNHRVAEEHARRIQSWVRRTPRARGCSILRFGVHKAGESRQSASIRRAFNNFFWYRDSPPLGRSPN